MTSALSSLMRRRSQAAGHAPCRRRVKVAAPAKGARVPRALFAVMLLFVGAGGCARASSGSGNAPSPTQTLPITSGNYPAFGHAPDFAWVAGRLVLSSPAGQCTYVVFSTHAGEPWGGRI